MKPSMIVYGVKGGKTRFAERIANHFGLEHVCQGRKINLTACNSIGFVESKESASFWEQIGFPIKSFEEVAKEINAAIELSIPQQGDPKFVGEYDVQYSRREPYYRRWWHGNCWSFAMLDFESQESKNLSAGVRHDPSWKPLWRGLSQEPINTKE